MDSLAERMREAMRLRGINQTQLANITGINRSSICVYLRGDYIPRQQGIEKIAIALGVDEAWLMGFDVEMSRIRSKKPEPTQAQQNLCELVLTLTDEECEKVTQIIQLLG